MVHPPAPRRVSDLGLVARCWAAGLILGVCSVFALSWGDSYERIDSIVGMAIMGTLVGLVVGVLAVAIRAGRRSLRGRTE